MLVIFFIVLFSAVDRLGPSGLVEKLGVENSYFIMLIVAFFGGFSAGGSFSFIATLVAFSAGGLNPFYLGIISGFALVLGDMIMFYLGFKGGGIIGGKLGEKIKGISFFVEKRFDKIIPFIVFVYLGLTPFPNDLLILSLAIIRYPLKKIYFSIILGDFTFAILVAVLASRGIVLFS